jgi:hypothetical protein
MDAQDDEALTMTNPLHQVGSPTTAWTTVNTRENFPGSAAAERAVFTVSILLAAAAIGSGIYTAASEEEEPEGEEAAAALRS